MVKNLFRNLGVLLSFALLNVANTSAQTTISTTYTPAPTVVLQGTAQSSSTYLTFIVQNTNNYPVKVTDVSFNHIDSAILNGGEWSNNGGTYTLWYSSTQLGGAPNINTANGWSVAGTSSGSVNPNIPGGQIVLINVITGANGFIAPNSTARFALAIDDTIGAYAYRATPTSPIVSLTPTSFTVGGVTLITSGTYMGSLPTPGTTGVFSFHGNITYERAKPRKPEVTVTPKSVCVGDSVTLVATADAYIPTPIYRWYLNGTLVHTGDTYGVGNLQASVTYKVTVSDSGEVSDSADAFINVKNPKPPLITGKTQYCLNEPFIPLDVNGADVRWYYIASGGSPIPVTPTFNTTTTNSIEYYAAQVVDGCESRDRTRIFFSAAPKPSEPTVTTPLIYCENDMANQLSASGEDLKWYYSQQGGVPSSVAPIPGTTVQQTSNYYVTQTIDGCESDRAEVEVVVTFRPNGLVLPSDDEICAGDSITIGYYGSAFPNSAYRWEFPEFSNRLSGLEQGPITLQFDSAGRYSIFLSVGEGFCYSQRYEEAINVKAIPTADILAKDDLCLGQTDLITVSYYTPTIETFSWNFDGGETSHFATDQGPFGVHWYTAGTKVIELTLLDNECTATVRDTVEVHEKPDARIIASNYTVGDVICSSDSIKLSAGTVEPTSSYTWSPSNFFNSHSDIPVTFARVDFTGYVKLRVEDEFGCYATDSLLIETRPCCDMQFPTAFSPNNDGKNDRFRALTLGNFDVKTFKIFNRYGQTIYEGRDITNGWDGSFNSEPQDMNTYFYFISYVCDGETIEQSGEFVLVR